MIQPQMPALSRRMFLGQSLAAGALLSTGFPAVLKGATETLRDLFFSNMSERAAKIMREDMAAMGPVRLKDVEEAQLHVVGVAKDLESRGEITISSGNEEDELIY